MVNNGNHQQDNQQNNQQNHHQDHHHDFFEGLAPLVIDVAVRRKVENRIQKIFLLTMMVLFGSAMFGWVYIYSTQFDCEVANEMVDVPLTEFLGMANQTKEKNNYPFVEHYREQNAVICAAWTDRSYIDRPYLVESGVMCALTGYDSPTHNSSLATCKDYFQASTKTWYYPFGKQCNAIETCDAFVGIDPCVGTEVVYHSPVQLNLLRCKGNTEAFDRAVFYTFLTWGLLMFLCNVHHAICKEYFPQQAAQVHRQQHQYELVPGGHV